MCQRRPQVVLYCTVDVQAVWCKLRGVSNVKESLWGRQCGVSYVVQAMGKTLPGVSWVVQA
eukprot:6557465-Pyramimonas_sp.AAC.1